MGGCQWLFELDQHGKEDLEDVAVNADVMARAYEAERGAAGASARAGACGFARAAVSTGRTSLVAQARGEVGMAGPVCGGFAAGLVG